jgi:hypothetical protein
VNALHEACRSWEMRTFCVDRENAGLAGLTFHELRKSALRNSVELRLMCKCRAGLCSSRGIQLDFTLLVWQGTQQMDRTNEKKFGMETSFVLRNVLLERQTVQLLSASTTS